ncbi:hypothetical protein C7M84_024023 [Penaeus vannamei]|uniref:Uncharacterized protein n=1 Tax=Penaeus vannamei TaxID=6689 RepID=A0A3R7PDJ9_PENVA|nr:hypothetical protein C7M84_024023 [Penaeus vannamei]
MLSLASGGGRLSLALLSARLCCRLSVGRLSVCLGLGWRHGRGSVWGALCSGGARPPSGRSKRPFFGGLPSFRAGLPAPTTSFYHPLSLPPYPLTHSPPPTSYSTPHPPTPSYRHHTLPLTPTAPTPPTLPRPPGPTTTTHPHSNPFLSNPPRPTTTHPPSNPPLSPTPQPASAPPHRDRGQSSTHTTRAPPHARGASAREATRAGKGAAGEGPPGAAETTLEATDARVPKSRSSGGGTRTQTGSQTRANLHAKRKSATCPNATASATSNLETVPEILILSILINLTIYGRRGPGLGPDNMTMAKKKDAVRLEVDLERRTRGRGAGGGGYGKGGRRGGVWEKWERRRRGGGRKEGKKRGKGSGDVQRGEKTK